MISAPIFHVNGDDPEACVRVSKLALEYRREFKKDVVIDLVCYRRRGHNEGDDPSYTQPLMYDLIEQKRSVRKLYTESLIGRGDITIEEAEQVLKDYQRKLEGVFTDVRDAGEGPSEWTTVPHYPMKANDTYSTAISDETLKRIADAHVSAPIGFTVHPKVKPQLERRAAAIAAGPIDWGTAEILAFGSLLMEGRPVRLAGQDSRRGTFVQRFATIIDRDNADEWTPLANLSEDQGDKDNDVKATVMFPDDKAGNLPQVGCWAACHSDARTMPGADEKKTKYVKEGALQLMQWRSAKGAKVADGTVTTERKMTGGKSER